MQISNALGLGGWDHMGGWGMSLSGWVFMALLATLGVWLILSIVRGDGPRPNRAMDLLDERYARGEIDRSSYLEQRADLDER